MTHQQTYWVWLERAWMSGLRLVVAQTVEDEPFCRIEPVRSHSCDEPAAIRLQIRTLRAMQRYVDRQSGGPGKGWFRIVEDPAQARRVIAQGKLAVIIGIESSDPLGCSESMGRPACTAATVDRRLDQLPAPGRAHDVHRALDQQRVRRLRARGRRQGRLHQHLQPLPDRRLLHTARCPQPGEGEEVDDADAVELQVLAQFFPGTQAVADERRCPPTRRAASATRAGLTALGRLPGPAR